LRGIIIKGDSIINKKASIKIDLIIKEDLISKVRDSSINLIDFNNKNLNKEKMDNNNFLLDSLIISKEDLKDKEIEKVMILTETIIIIDIIIMHS
jgi:hypothetical protein